MENASDSTIFGGAPAVMSSTRSPAISADDAECPVDDYYIFMEPNTK